MNYALLTTGYDASKGMYFVPVSHNTHAEIAKEDTPYPVHEILTRFYGESFETVISNFLQKEPEKMTGSSLPAGSTNYRLLDAQYFRTQSLLFQPTDSTIVDFLVSGSVQADWNGRQICKRVIFRIRYILDLRPCHAACLGPLVELAENWKNEPVFGEEYHQIYQQKYPDLMEVPLNDYLLPILRNEDYETLSKQFLAFYYPDELEQGEPFTVNAEELARRMDMDIFDVRFQDTTVWGQVYYNSGEAKLLTDDGDPYTAEITKPGIILLSKDHCKTQALRNSTIMHECCHMFLDRWFFLLQFMTGCQYTAYTTRKREKKTVERTVLDWMEFQCEKLPAFLLMEQGGTTEFVGNVLKQNQHGTNVEALSLAIRAVSEKYNISKTMAKYRLIGLGFRGAEGIGNYVDGHSVPDHGCANWPEGVTYTISTDNAMDFLRHNSWFAEKVECGRYLYIENHFCVNNQKYFRLNAAGEASLSEYARTHIDECCIAFTVTGKRTNGAYNSAFAARNRMTENKNQYRFCYELSEKNDEKVYSRENNVFADDSWLWGKLYSQLPEEFCGAVKEILKVKGLTREKVALELGVDRRVLYRVLNASRISIEHVVGLCLALKLPFYISERLIQLSGNWFKPNDEAHQLYLNFLCMSGALTVERCNDILEQHNLPKLFGEGKAA